MRKSFLLFSVLGVALCSVVQAQDLSVQPINYMPCASAATNQQVSFEIYNCGPEDMTYPFKAGFICDGNTVCEKEFNDTVPKYESFKVVLPYHVELQYGESYEFKMFVHHQNDPTTSNDTINVAFTMPILSDYPFTWNSDNFDEVSGTGNYNYEADSGMFHINTKKTNWRGNVSINPIAFQEGSVVEGSYSLKTATDIVVTVTAEYGGKSVVVDEHTFPTLSKTTEHHYTFKPEGPASIVITTSPMIGIMSYGNLYIGEFAFCDAVPDMSVHQLLAPATEALACKEEGYTVTTTYVNNSPFEMEAPTFGFDFADQHVVETYGSTIAPGDTIVHTFATRLDASVEKNGILQTWLKSANDKRKENDTLTTQMVIYKALDFPYHADFSTDVRLWNTFDSNGDDTVWDFGDNSTFGRIAIFPSGTIENDDWLISPAINMPAGRSRVVFYYGGKYTGSQHLQLLTGPEPTPASMTEILFDTDVTNTTLKSGFALVELQQPGIRYFAFRLNGSNDEVAICDVKIDRGNDLCIEKVSLTAESGFGLGQSDVVLSYSNHGVDPQENVVLKYWLSDNDNTISQDMPDAIETVPFLIEPGQTVSYTFSRKADLSEMGKKYSVLGAIGIPVGEDQRNDSIRSASVDNWKYRETPYQYGFEDEETNSRWIIMNAEPEGNSFWMTAYSFSGATTGIGVLGHEGIVPNGKEDWAFSEAFYLTKGSYELSFFYRTFKNWDTEEYKQSLRVMMGHTADPVAMETPIYEHNDFTISGSRSKKVNRLIEIQEDGVYYFGFGNTSSSEYGVTFVDDIALQRITPGHPLPYETDLETSGDDLTRYYDSSSFVRWENTVTSDGSNVITATRSIDDDDMQTAGEGHLMLPCLRLEKDRIVKVIVDYSLVCQNPDTQMSLDIYGGNINNPENLALLGSLPQTTPDQSFEEASISFETGSGSDNYFIGIRTNAPAEMNEMPQDRKFIYTVSVKDIRVQYDTSSALPAAINETPFAITIEGDLARISAPENSRIEIVNLTGNIILNRIITDKNTTLDVSSISGIHIVRLISDDAINTVKVLF